MAAKKTKQATDVRDSVVKYLEANERSLKWLSGKTNIPYSTLYFILYRKERRLKESKISMINKVLGTDFKL
jgi:predicted transcriptional regulator